MIEIRDLNVTFNGKDFVLKDINLHFKNRGLYIINGESGSGKTTLLNALANLIKYQGTIKVNGTLINKFNEEHNDDYRLYDLGFIFQDFKLFEYDTVLNNILLPLEMAYNYSSDFKKRKALDLLEIVDLRTKAYEKVKILSGGEKQRVAIARSLINSPKIILADEPTGSLDSINGIKIMEILKNISKKSLVIIVSHDQNLTYEFADYIIKLKDGKLLSFSDSKKVEEKNKIIFNDKKRNYFKKASIPLHFLLRHIKETRKERKWRSLICDGVISLGLIGVGLSFSLSTLLKNNLQTLYSSLIDDNKVMVTINKTERETTNIIFANYEEAKSLQSEKENKIDDIGITYYADFENNFKDDDFLYMQKDNAILDSFTSRSINDFCLLEDSSLTFYPQKVSHLEDDEIYISINALLVNKICSSLRITKSVKSLSDYLINNDIFVYFHFCNQSWEYDDEQLLKIKGFGLSTVPLIYHTNIFWNKVMFEDNMRFPTISDMNNMVHPWDLRKIYYLKSKNIENVLINGRFSNSFKKYILEIADERFHPLLFKDSSIKKDRALIFKNFEEEISPTLLNYFYETTNNICEPIFGSNFGYAIYPDYMMMGFALNTYFSFSNDSLDEVIDIESYLSPLDNNSIELPSDVLEGHFSKPLNEGVTFKLLGNKKIKGRKPINCEEIVVSTYFLKKLTGSEDIPKEDLKIAFTKSIRELKDGTLVKEFKNISLSIVGVIESSRYEIYHEEYWPLVFFQLQLGVSRYDLNVNSICFSVKENTKTKDIITKLEKAFPNFKITDPFSNLHSGIEETSKYIEIALLFFSLIATIISVILLSLTNSLFTSENQKEIALARCLGASKKEAKKFTYVHSLFLCLISFVFSSFELVVVSYFVNIILGKSLGIVATTIINPLAFLFMFILAIFISLLSSFFCTLKVNKKDPLNLFRGK